MVLYTSLSNAGFICALPVVVTPLLDWLFLRKRPDRRLAVALRCVHVGMGLMTLQRGAAPGAGRYHLPAVRVATPGSGADGPGGPTIRRSTPCSWAFCSWGWWGFVMGLSPSCWRSPRCPGPLVRHRRRIHVPLGRRCCMAWAFACRDRICRDSDTVRHLRSLGIPVAVGHSADNLQNAQLVIRTAAIHDDNPEISGAVTRGASPSMSVPRRGGDYAAIPQRPMHLRHPWQNHHHLHVHPYLHGGAGRDPP